MPIMYEPCKQGYPIGSVFIFTERINPSELAEFNNIEITWLFIGSITISTTTLYFWKRTA